MLSSLATPAALFQNTLEVTIPQLVAWTPNPKADCSNLVLGDAYCVSSPPLPTRVKRYTIVSGDSCSKIWMALGVNGGTVPLSEPGAGHQLQPDHRTVTLRCAVCQL